MHALKVKLNSNNTQMTGGGVFLDLMQQVLSSHTHTQSYTHTHSYTHTQSYTHTHTVTHTHTLCTAHSQAACECSPPCQAPFNKQRGEVDGELGKECKHSSWQPPPCPPAVSAGSRWMGGQRQVDTDLEWGVLLCQVVPETFPR